MNEHDDKEASKVYKEYCTHCGDVGVILKDGPPGSAPTAYACTCKKASWKPRRLTREQPVTHPKPPSLPVPRQDPVRTTHKEIVKESEPDTSFNFGFNAIDPFDDPF